MSRKSFSVCILALAITLPSPAKANKIQKLDISPYDGFSNAPLIEVYSTNGEKWNAVNKSEAVNFKVKLNAECQFEGKGNKAYEGDLMVEGFDIIGDTDPADFLIPNSNSAEATFRYTDGAGQPVNLIEVCNTELTKRVSENKDKTKYHILSKGFTVDYAGAFSVKYRMYCRATGLGKTDYGSDSTLVNARIRCAASDLAKDKIPEKPARAKVVPARQTPLVKSVQFKAEPQTYQGKCPMGVKFNGSITASRAGTVKYQYTSDDGKKSPDLTVEFEQAGTKSTRTWNRTLSQPDPGSKIAATSGDAGWDHQGWYRMDIIEPNSNKSAKADYKVRCQAPTPARARKQD